MTTGDIEFSLDIHGWQPPIKENRWEDWCKCDMRVKIGDYLDYSVLDDEFLEFSDMVCLSEVLQGLLNGGVSDDMLIAFIEPDLSFELHPKFTLGSDELDVSAELEIALRRPDTNYTGAVLTLPLERGDIESLLKYLKGVTNV